MGVLPWTTKTKIMATGILMAIYTFKCGSIQIDNKSTPRKYEWFPKTPY